MARAKPSNWQPGGIELLDVSELYPDADLRAIVGRIGRFEGNRYDAVESKIFDVAAWLNASLHYDSRPTASEKRAALSPIAAKLAELRKAFAALDQDTAALLKGVAGRAAYGLQAEPPDFAPPFGGSGDLRYALVVVGLERMEDWIHEALAELPEVKKGRKPHDYVREAAYRLLCIWQEHAPQENGRILPSEPTIGQFLELLRAVTRPVFKKYDMSPDLEAAAKDVLYRGWQPD